MDEWRCLCVGTYRVCYYALDRCYTCGTARPVLAPVPVADAPEKVGTWIGEYTWRCACVGAYRVRPFALERCYTCGTARPVLAPVPVADAPESRARWISNDIWACGGECPRHHYAHSRRCSNCHGAAPIFATATLTNATK